jgi:crotonobetaine/carnitine-CoA ligase
MDQLTDAARTAMVESRDVPWLLRQWAERTPGKTFLVWEPFSGDQQSWTYSEFHRDVETVAAALNNRGIAAGERVLIHMDNSPEFLIAWFACARIGAVAVSTNTRSVARDMEYFAAHAGAVCALTQTTYARMIHDSAPDIRFLVVAHDNEDADNEDSALTDIPHLAFDELLEENGECPARPVEPMANLGIQYTSGTTSRPKAVLWTHANAIWGAQINAMHMSLVHEDITLTFLPLFHTNAQSYSMLGTLWVGGTMVVQPRFSASRFWGVSIRNKCTWTSLIPFCVKALQGHEPPAEHQYRFWGPAVRLPEVDEALGLQTMGWWGMTETITHGIVTDIHHPGDLMAIGRASPGYEISIRRPDGSPIGPNERGALYIRGVRGVSMFKEYFGNEQATSESFDEDGWFDTGDMIRMGSDGMLYFSDRGKDMLKVGAENVAASEVEAVILESGWVSEVAVVGQEHDMLDEVPVAFVIALPDAPEGVGNCIIDYCKDKLPDFKAVRDVHVVDELPRSTLEKIAKNVLRERLPKITVASKKD